MDTQSYISQQIQALVSDSGKNKSKPIPPTPKIVNKKPFPLFAIIAIIMLLMIVGVACSKSELVQSKIQPNAQVDKPVKPIAKPIDKPIDNKPSDLEVKVADLTSQMDRLSRQIWLLMLTTNENAWINSQINAKYHRGTDAEYIYFENDWNLSREPKLELDEQQKERLKPIKI